MGVQNECKKMKISIIGLGKVGIPIACLLSRNGNIVNGYDNNPQLLEKLSKGINPLEYEPNVNLDLFQICSTLSLAISNSDMIIVVVPTPTNTNNDGLSGKLINDSLNEIEKYLIKPTIIHVVSTLDPRDVVEVLHQRKNMRIVYGPVLIRLGTVINDIINTDVFFLGHMNDSEAANYVLQAFFPNGLPNKTTMIEGSFLDIACAKLAINASLSMRVAWANDVAIKCDALGADKDVVFKALWSDKRLGGKGYMVHGPPPSGPCLWRDQRVYNAMYPTDLTSAAQKTHDLVFDQIVENSIFWIKKQIQKSQSNKVAILGVVYNPDALDITGSIGLLLANKGKKYGWEVNVFDPASKYVLKDKEEIFKISNSIDDAVNDASCAIIGCMWPEIKMWKKTAKIPVYTTDWRK